MRVEVRDGRPAEGLQVAFAAEGPQPRPLSTLAYRAAANETVLLPQGKQWTLTVGLGKAADLSLERVRQAAGTAAKTARARGFKTLVLPLLSDRRLGSPEAMAHALVEGALLSLYRCDKYREVPKHELGKQVERLVLAVPRPTQLAEARRGAHKAQVICEAVYLARDLINGPPNLITPTYLAQTAKSLARHYHLKCQVRPFAQLKRLGFGGIAGVAQGSQHPAQFIVLEYRPARARATVALCGKGITFDSGGLSLKSAAKMELMKYDMSGAAAVLGTIKAAAELKLPVRVVGIIAATENMPSGTAQRPGDILTTLSGKTVEVINTDAEGRLVLADCLHYAKRFKPDAVIDIATLTGACVIALGSEAIGLLSTDEALAAEVTRAAEAVHERVWRLPLWAEYARPMKSDIADLRNISTTGEAGTIMGAKFLEAFTEGLRWAHLDIASTAWAEREKPYVPKGAAGIGVRLLVRFLETWKA
jgi:leucyl aminopeptidase